jgi:hypothetical protein
MPGAIAGGQQLTLRRMLGPSMLLNAVVPAVLYYVLTSRGVASFNALVTVALFPLIGICIGLVRRHSVDAIGALVLAFIVAGLATSLISGDERFLLVKESLITGLFGSVCLVSLVLPRPLMFYFGRSFSAAGNPEAGKRYDALWQNPDFRTTNRVLTIGWGCGYLAEAVVRVVLLGVLPITAFLAVSQVLALAVTALLMLWTVRYVRAARQRLIEHGVQLAN